MYFIALDKIAELLESFERQFNCRENTWWYTLALCAEYAAIARKQIGQKHFVPHADEFQLNAWKYLAACEKQIIRYQAIINHMGNNLQCATVATLINFRRFLPNSMPYTNGGNTSQQFEKWIHSYSTFQQFSLDEEQVQRVPACANRMLTQQEYPFASPKSKLEIRCHTIGSESGATQNEFTRTINEYLRSVRVVSILRIQIIPVRY